MSTVTLCDACKQPIKGNVKKNTIGVRISVIKEDFTEINTCEDACCMVCAYKLLLTAAKKIEPKETW